MRGVVRPDSAPLERTTRLFMNGMVRRGVANQMVQKSRDVKKAGKVPRLLVHYSNQCRLTAGAVHPSTTQVGTLGLGGCKADHRQAVANARGVDSEPAVSKLRFDVLLSNLGTEH